MIKEFSVEYSDAVSLILVILAYVALFVLYIILIIKIWKACNAVMEVRDRINDLSYRDTARFVAEINKGAISDQDQEEAQAIIKQ